MVLALLGVDLRRGESYSGMSAHPIAGFVLGMAFVHGSKL